MQSRTMGDYGLVGSALHNMAFAMFQLGRWDESEQYVLECLSIAREYNDIFLTIDALLRFMELNLMKGDFDSVASCLSEGLALARERDIPVHIEKFLNQRSLWHWLHGQYAEARHFAQETLEAAKRIAGEHTDVFLLGYPLISLGAALCGLGDYQTSSGYLRCGLKWVEYGSAPNISLRCCLTGIAMTLAQDNQPDKALELIALVVNHRHSPSWWLEGEPMTQALVAELRETFAGDEFDAIWERGSKLDLDETIALWKLEA